MKFLKLFRRETIHTEDVRRATLKQRGRIGDATVTDLTHDEQGRTTGIHFVYEIGGVDYESSHQLDSDQQSRKADYAPGASVTIRYDPRQPANSIVV